jgi:hypothetical protein
LVIGVGLDTTRVGVVPFVVVRFFDQASLVSIEQGGIWVDDEWRLTP